MLIKFRKEERKFSSRISEVRNKTEEGKTVRM